MYVQDDSVKHNEESEKATLFNAKCSEVDVRKSGRKKISRMLTAISNTLVGANLIRRDTLPTDPTHDMQKTHISMGSPGDYKFKKDSVMEHWVGLGGHVNQVIFDMAPTLATKVIFCTAFIDKHVKCIELDQRLVIPKKKSKVSIFTSFSKGAIATIDLENELTLEEAVFEAVK